MIHTLKEIKTAILVISVLCRNEEVPAPLREALEPTRQELAKWYAYLRAKEENVPSTSSKTKT